MISTAWGVSGFPSLGILLIPSKKVVGSLGLRSSRAFRFLLGVSRAFGFLFGISSLVENFLRGSFGFLGAFSGFVLGLRWLFWCRVVHFPFAAPGCLGRVSLGDFHKGFVRSSGFLLKDLRCLAAFGELDVFLPFGFTKLLERRLTSKSFIENSESCRGWKCRRMDLEGQHAAFWGALWRHGAGGEGEEVYKNQRLVEEC